MRSEEYLDKHTDIDAKKMQNERPMLHYNISKAMRDYAKHILIGEMEKVMRVVDAGNRVTSKQWISKRIEKLK